MASAPNTSSGVTERGDERGDEERQVDERQERRPRRHELSRARCRAAGAPERPEPAAAPGTRELGECRLELRRLRGRVAQAPGQLGRLRERRREQEEHDSRNGRDDHDPDLPALVVEREHEDNRSKRGCVGEPARDAGDVLDDLHAGPRTLVHYSPRTGVPRREAEITPVEPDPGHAGEGSHGRRHDHLGHRAGAGAPEGPRPRRPGAALGVARRLAARDRRRRAARAGALTPGRAARDPARRADRQRDARERGSDRSGRARARDGVDARAARPRRLVRADRC